MNGNVTVWSENAFKHEKLENKQFRWWQFPVKIKLYSAIYRLLFRYLKQILFVLSTFIALLVGLESLTPVILKDSI
jgi:hypothetical protein